jgi:glycosyltransferase involved in cell wall biosynthesis
MKDKDGSRMLMLCYYFPPLLDVGCKRSVAFAKYLKKYGWYPHVLSVRNPDRHFCRLGCDQPPPGVPTFYVRSLFSLYWLFGKINGFLCRLLKVCGIQMQRNYLHDLFSIPDLFVGWVPGAILKGYAIIKKHNIDYIYVSCSPFSSALAGMALKKLTGRPLVVDFRDPMAVNVPDTLAVPAFRRKINLAIERRIIENADIFLVTTEELRRGYLEQYPEIESKIFTIYNGFDHEATPAGSPEKFDKFTIVYGGNMYFEAIRSRAFFDALAQLREEGRINSENFQFLYFGEAHRVIDQIAAESAISDLVQSLPPISHGEMLKVFSRSQLQLLRIIKPMISTKLFEGIALNLPFLATIPQGEVADILARYSPSSQVVPEDSPQEIGAAIVAAMTAYRQGAIQDNLVAQFLESFSREEMTRKLERVIEEKYGEEPACFEKARLSTR